MRDSVLKIYSSTLDQARKLVDSVPCERFAELPHPGAKHPGWVLGHLSLASGMTAAMLKGEDGLEGVPAAWMASCMVVPTADRSAFGTKEELLAQLERTHAVVLERLPHLPDAAMGQPFPKEEYRSFWPTVGDAVTYLLAYHEGYHLGQLSAWRHASGFGSAE